MPLIPSMSKCVKDLQRFFGDATYFSRPCADSIHASYASQVISRQLHPTISFRCEFHAFATPSRSYLKISAKVQPICPSVWSWGRVSYGHTAKSMHGMRSHIHQCPKDPKALGGLPTSNYIATICFSFDLPSCRHPQN